MKMFQELFGPCGLQTFKYKEKTTCRRWQNSSSFHTVFK